MTNVALTGSHLARIRSWEATQSHATYLSTQAREIADFFTRESTHKATGPVMILVKKLRFSPLASERATLEQLLRNELSLRQSGGQPYQLLKLRIRGRKLTVWVPKPGEK